MNTESHTSMIRIEQGYRPTLLGRVTTMHANYYSKHYKFGSVFEAKVATEMAEFLSRLDRPKNRIWSAVLDGKIMGSISIDGEDLGVGKCHLRWFIVNDKVRGTGSGKQLLSAAIKFSEECNFKETHLWTFKGLDTARQLYEGEGFILVDEKAGTRWGTEVIEQKFIRQAK